MHGKPRHYWQWIAAATLVAAVLRGVGLGAQSLWVDELLTLRTIASPDRSVWIGSFIDNSNTPLYFWFVQLVWRVLGDSEVSLRLVSALAGTATIPVAAEFIRRLTANRRAATLTAFLLALNPLHLWFSQEARPYSLFILAGCAALLAAMRVSERADLRRLTLFCLLSIAAFLVHKTGVLFPFLACLYSLLSRGIKKTLPVFWACVLTAIVVVPIGAFAARYATVYSIDRPMTGLEIGYTFITYVGGYSFGPAVREIQGMGAKAAVLQNLPQLGVAAALLVAVLPPLFAARRQRGMLMLVLLVVITIGVNAIAVCLSPYAYNVRYTLPALIGFLGAVALSLARPSRISTGVVTFAVVLFLWADLQWFAVGKYGKEDSRGAVHLLQQSIPDGSTVAVAPNYLVPTLDYYAHRLNAEFDFVGVNSLDDLATEPAASALLITRRHHLPEADSLIQAYRAPGALTAGPLECVGYEVFYRPR